MKRNIKFPKSVPLLLLAKDYIGNDYVNTFDCAVSRATRRQFPTATYVNEGGTLLIMGIGDERVSYSHDDFCEKRFEMGRVRAERSYSIDPNYVIDKLILTREDLLCR